MTKKPRIVISSKLDKNDIALWTQAKQHATSISLLCGCNDHNDHYLILMPLLYKQK